MPWSFALAVTTFVLLFGLLSLVSARLYDSIKSRLDGVVPEQGAIILLAYCVGPLLIGLLSVGLLFSPAGITFIDIHCHLGHCDQHTPFISSSESLLILASLTMMLCIPALYAVTKLLSQHRRQLSLWRNLSSPAGKYFLIDHNIPVAFTLGLFKPRIYISKGLRAQLNGKDLEVVLQHETAHIYRYDNFIKFVASLSTILFPGTLRAQLLGALQLTQEMCCDKRAAIQQNDTLTVAQALLHVNRCAHTNYGVALCGIKSSKIELRVKALLEPPSARLSKTEFILALATLSLIPIILIGPLHHLVEKLL